MSLTITISGVKSIRSNEYENNKDIIKVIIKEGIEVIEEDAFVDCSEITYLSFPDSLIRISESAFTGCSKLTYLRLPKKLEEIGEGAFYECSSLKVIYCSDRVSKLLTEDVILSEKFSVEEMRRNSEPKVYLNRFYWNPSNNRTSFKYLNDTIKTLFLCALRNDLTNFLPNIPDEMYRKILSMIEC
jgi:hypothetical protein